MGREKSQITHPPNMGMYKRHPFYNNSMCLSQVSNRFFYSYLHVLSIHPRWLMIPLNFVFVFKVSWVMSCFMNTPNMCAPFPSLAQLTNFCCCALFFFFNILKKLEVDLNVPKIRKEAWGRMGGQGECNYLKYNLKILGV